MNRRTLVIGSVAGAVVAFAGISAFYPHQLAGEATTPENNLVRFHSPIIGKAEAPVTIVEFLDPSCEACRAYYPIVKQIMGMFDGDVRLVIRYAPLHEGSDEAVMILEAARLQGKFEPVLEAIFRDQPIWAAHSAPDLEKAWAAAQSAGLDVAKAREDAKSEAISRVLEQDIADMKAVDLKGTPTFFVNGKQLLSNGPRQLLELVATEVEAAQSGKPAS